MGCVEFADLNGVCRSLMDLCLCMISAMPLRTDPLLGLEDDAHVHLHIKQVSA